jgi:hypothetical protein
LDFLGAGAEISPKIEVARLPESVLVLNISSLIVATGFFGVTILGSAGSEKPLGSAGSEKPLGSAGSEKPLGSLSLDPPNSVSFVELVVCFSVVEVFDEDFSFFPFLEGSLFPLGATRDLVADERTAGSVDLISVSIHV